MVECCGKCAHYREGGFCFHTKKDVAYFGYCKKFTVNYEFQEPPKPKPSPKTPIEEQQEKKAEAEAEKPIVTEKRCKCCGELLPIEQFVKNRRAADGHTSICYLCNRAKERPKRTTLTDEERKIKARERKKRYYLADPERARRQSREYAKTWRKKHPERAREISLAAYYRRREKEIAKKEEGQ